MIISSLKLLDRKRLRCIFFIILVIIVSCCFYAFYLCPKSQCLTHLSTTPTSYFEETYTKELHDSNASAQTFHSMSTDSQAVDHHEEGRTFRDSKDYVAQQSFLDDPKFFKFDASKDKNYRFTKKFIFDKKAHENVVTVNWTDLHSMNAPYQFDIEGNDVLVFLHMQKTGGTVFGRHLVKNMDIDKPCICYYKKKKCDCENSQHRIWLFSRFSTGWVCGLHADWTELQNCVDSSMNKKERFRRHRRYLYITILRDPYYRYISEWRHVKRGSTWLSAFLRCNGRSATLEEVPFCYEGENWEGVTLEEFMACPHNLAVNRQTRMLADLSQVNCYDKSAMPQEQRDSIMLQSAKDNLLDMAFFGLTEYQVETQMLFEETFGMSFIEDFEQRGETHASKEFLTDSEKQQILQLNFLDVQLYKYAKTIFLDRFASINNTGTIRTIP